MTEGKIPSKEMIGLRLKPKAKQELERLAHRRGDRPATYMGKILEAHANGLVFCPTCGHEHEIHHPARQTK